MKLEDLGELSGLVCLRQFFTGLGLVRIWEGRLMKCHSRLKSNKLDVPVLYFEVTSWSCETKKELTELLQELRLRDPYWNQWSWHMLFVVTGLLGSLRRCGSAGTVCDKAGTGELKIMRLGLRNMATRVLQATPKPRPRMFCVMQCVSSNSPPKDQPRSPSRNLFPPGSLKPQALRELCVPWIPGSGGGLRSPELSSP